MKAGDVQVGSRYALLNYQGVTIGEALETRVPIKTNSWSKDTRKVGVRLMVTEVHARGVGEVGEEVLLQSGKLVDADAYSVTSRIEQLARERDHTLRVAAASARLGIISAAPLRGVREEGAVTLSLDDYEDVAQRVQPRGLSVSDDAPEYPDDATFDTFEGYHDAFEAGMTYREEVVAHGGHVIAPGGAFRVSIEGHVIELRHVVDGSGGHAIELAGVGCALDGEMPGLYYPTAAPAEQPVGGEVIH